MDAPTSFIATVPAAFGTWAYALARFGTLTLKDVLEPAIAYAEFGFPVYPDLHACLAGLEAVFKEHWPTSADNYLPAGSVPQVGTLLTNGVWAETLKRVVAVEKRHRRHGRAEAIQAAITRFRRPSLLVQRRTGGADLDFMQRTEILDASGKRHRGLLERADFAPGNRKREFLSA